MNDDENNIVIRQPMVSFRADAEVLRALQVLESAVSSSVISRRKRSVAIRQAILDAVRRLEGTNTEE